MSRELISRNPRRPTSGSYDVILIGTKTGSSPGNSAVGIGTSVNVSAPDGVAIGTGSQSQGNGTIGIGSNSNASTGGSISIGRSSLGGGVGNGGVAIGNTAKARDDSISIGYQAGLGQGSYQAARNILIGTQTGYSISNASCVDNIAIGYKASYGLTTGTANVHLGSYTGYGSTGPGTYKTTTASNQVLLGYNVHPGTATQYENIIGIGANARPKGENAISIGYGSGTDDTSGIALGHGAYGAGIEAVAIGRAASTGSSGDYQVAIGRGATTGDDNSIAIGRSTNASGAGSVAIGTDASGVGASSSANTITLGTSLQTTASAGGRKKAYVAKTGAYTLTTGNHIVECTTGTFNITLPTAVGDTGREFIVVNSGTGVITVNTTSSQTINGITTKTLNQYERVTVVSNGANWIITA